MDTNSQWPQIYEAENNNNNNNNKNNNKKAILVRPNIKEQAALNCPRCNSTHTKFCYYNNYSLSQPRYLCKTCKRYWTEGGNLRNVPVGGGSRNNKTKRLPSSSKKSNLSPPRILITPTQNPSRTNNIIDHGQTLNLDFNPPASSCHGMSEFGVLPFGLNFKNLNPHENPNFCSASGVFTTAASLVSMPPVAPSHPSVFSSSSFGGGFKPSLSFSLDNHQGYSGNNNNLEGVQENTMIATSSRVAAAGFPPLDQEMMIKPFDHGHGGSNGYWHGMINDGGSW